MILSDTLQLYVLKLSTEQDTWGSVAKHPYGNGLKIYQQRINEYKTYVSRNCVVVCVNDITYDDELR